MKEEEYKVYTVIKVDDKKLYFKDGYWMKKPQGHIWDCYNGKYLIVNKETKELNPQ